MRRAVAAGVALVSLATEARAGVQPEIITATTFVSGPVAPATTVDTLGQPVAVGRTWNPSLRLGITGGFVAEFTERSRLSARWGVFREQHLCDTCGGDPSDDVGNTGSELLGSTDLDVRASHDFTIKGESLFRLGAIAVLPASRDALVCNPMIGSPGASAALVLPAGGTTVTFGTSAQFPLYVNDAAPVGKCSPPLEGSGTVDSLAGPVEPTPYEDGEMWGAQNPALLLSGSIAWSNPHALFSGITEKLSTGISIGVDAQRDRRDGATTVDTLGADAEVAASKEPVTLGLPWSLTAGWALSEHTGLVFGLSNHVPSVLADPGGMLRVLPATTAVTLAFTARP